MPSDPNTAEAEYANGVRQYTDEDICRHVGEAIREFRLGYNASAAAYLRDAARMIEARVSKND